MYDYNQLGPNLIVSYIIFLVKHT